MTSKDLFEQLVREAREARLDPVGYKRKQVERVREVQKARKEVRDAKLRN
jgi:hypothetical protein